MNVKTHLQGDPMPFRSRKTVLVLGLTLLLILALSLSSQLELPPPDGAYAVGRKIFNWVDPSRPEVLTEDSNDVREVVAMVWYPAQAGTGVKAGYFPSLSSVSEALIQSGEVGWLNVFGLRFVRSESPLDAIPQQTQGPFPVVILSPGNGTNIEFYSSLAGEIASHGYIVVGLNHPYDVPAVQLSNGDIAPYHKDQWLLDAASHQTYIEERIKVRTADILFALNQLEEIVASNGALAGIIDLDSVAVAGHSLGGITASEACKADTRLKACLNFDGIQKGGPFSMEETAPAPEQPFMFLTKEAQLHPKLLERFEAMPESYWVVVHGASHQSFTDGPSLQPSVLPGLNRADELMDLIQQYTLAFLDQTLKGESSDLLSKTVAEENVSVNVFPSH
jgi:dienelactone hydrolase